MQSLFDRIAWYPGKTELVIDPDFEPEVTSVHVADKTPLSAALEGEWSKVYSLYYHYAPSIRGVYVVMDSTTKPVGLELDKIVYVGSSTALENGIRARLQQFGNAARRGRGCSSRNSAGWNYHERLKRNKRDPFNVCVNNLWFVYLDMDNVAPWNIQAKEYALIAEVSNTCGGYQLINTTGAEW